MPESPSHLRKWLSVYASALAIVVALGVGVVLVQGNGDLSAPATKFAIGLNLIASALFSLLFAALASWVLERNQRANIEETLTVNADRVFTHISALRDRYLPVAEFPASNTFGVEFNRSLMDSMERSSLYDFYGPSARFVATRMRALHDPPREIRIAVIDPGLDASIRRRAADRLKWVSSAGKPLEVLEADFREELRMTIVSLFDLRSICPVHVVYTNDMVVYRMELTDESIFFSWYHGNSSSGKEMPEAAQFSNGSLYYQVLRQEMARRFEVLSRKVVFDSGSTDEELMRHLNTLDGQHYDPARIAGLRQAYADYTEEFSEHLRGIGY